MLVPNLFFYPTALKLKVRVLQIDQWNGSSGAADLAVINANAELYGMHCVECTARLAKARTFSPK